MGASPWCSRRGSPGLAVRSWAMHSHSSFRRTPACSYFYATLYLGTPAKKFAVIVDTGSTMTYVPCSNCGSGCGPNHAARGDAAFNPQVRSRRQPGCIGSTGNCALQPTAVCNPSGCTRRLAPAGLCHCLAHHLCQPKVQLWVAAVRLCCAAVHVPAQLCGAEQQQRYPAGGCAGAARWWVNHRAFSSAYQVCLVRQHAPWSAGLGAMLQHVDWLAAS